MAENSGNYKRIAKNTIMLYFRMLLIMFVSLYTVRALLATLGQEDYGLYNVIGGIVVMFSFLTHVLSSASQRFFAYEIGKADYTKLSKTYSVMLMLYAIVVAIVILLAETIGLWFFHNKMTIPVDRMYAAEFVYQFSILSFCWKVVTAPHQAIIIANEKMGVYAYVGIAEVLLQLILVLLLGKLPGDSLIAYSVLMFVIVFIINCIYIVYSRIKYRQIRFMANWDNELAKNVVSYSGWTLFGAIASICRSQGLNIILNVYFTPIVNAARGIAHNVNSSVSSFAGNFYTAVKPQIVKYYAQRNYDACFKLVFRSTKFSYFLLLLFIVPIFCYTPEILTLWLNNYPDYAIVFTRLIIITALIDALGNPIITFNQATGDIKLFQIVVSLIYMANIPLSIAAFEMGAGPKTAFVISICISILAMSARLIISNYKHHFPLVRYVKEVLLPLLLVTVLSITVAFVWLFIDINPSKLYGLTINVGILMASIGLLSFMLGFNKQERQFALSFIIKKIHKNEIYN